MFPLRISFAGLMIKFRLPGISLGLVIMCQVFGSLTSGTIEMARQTAVMAFVPCHEVTFGLALLSIVTGVGAAIKSSNSDATRTNLMPSKLAAYPPEDLKREALLIHDDLTRQLSFEWGSSDRDGIVLV
ncbi:uncharacterized protein LY79DRAFT_562820 [Colletotrichum navitas]|uniref:Uncharacterized protein n=1 Tax=Colletotrichum navitas TaxID=681940 RepID=A0AAD8PTH3_9PEZI|nr:uncharacterized protein LY79DRAFT_562820 [Colletotrichum navitas]KAK1579915.1 hypothetical protein LY79DRAFT_562820 [Colletotrichum navitas]